MPHSLWPPPTPESDNETKPIEWDAIAWIATTLVLFIYGSLVNYSPVVLLACWPIGIMVGLAVSTLIRNFGGDK